MDLSTDSLLASLVVGTVGFGLFLYGKKQVRVPQLVTGLVMMVYPYFLASTPWMLGVAGVLLGVLWLATRAGM